MMKTQEMAGAWLLALVMGSALGVFDDFEFLLFIKDYWYVLISMGVFLLVWPFPKRSHYHYDYEPSIEPEPVKALEQTEEESVTENRCSYCGAPRENGIKCPYCGTRYKGGGKS